MPISGLPQIPIQPVIQAAKEAGAAILQHLTEDLQVDSKTDESPVTAADKAADVIIKQHLRAIAPTDFIRRGYS